MEGAALALVFERRVDVATVPVLRSHVIAGRPVLPMALILEWLAQGALQRNPGLAFAGIDELRILKGVVLRDGRAETLRVLAGKPSREGASYRVPVALEGTTDDGRSSTHARGVAVLADRPPQGRRAIGEMPLAPLAVGTAELYRDMLFHGPDLHGLGRIEGCDDRGIAATAATAPPPSSWVDRPPRQSWLADPLALDCAFQMMIIWSRERIGGPSLPTSLGRYRQFRRAFPADGVRILARVTRTGAHRATADIEFLDPGGDLVARIDDYECVIDASLGQAFRHNRLEPARG